MSFFIFFLFIRYGGWSFDADGSKFKSTVWFNNKGHHALPSFYNGLSNTMLRAMIQNNGHEYGRYQFVLSSVYNVIQ